MKGSYLLWSHSIYVFFNGSLGLLLLVSHLLGLVINEIWSFKWPSIRKKLHNIPWNYNFASHSWNRPGSHRMKAVGSVSLEQADREAVFLRSGSKALAMEFTDSEGFRIGRPSCPHFQLWFIFHSKKIPCFSMLLWLNFSRVAILHPKQSRRICSVVEQHFSECLGIMKVHCCTIFSSKQGRENQSMCQPMPGSAPTAPKLTKTPERSCAIGHETTWCWDWTLYSHRGAACVITRHPLYNCRFRLVQRWQK